MTLPPPAARPWLWGALVAALTSPTCANLNDDKVDPPELNPHPVERVKLRVIAPQSLNVHLAATYPIGTWLGTFGGGGRYCGSEEERHPRPDSVGTPLPTVEVPVTLQRVEQGYLGEFQIDRFEPGRCRWQFGELIMILPARTVLTAFSEHTVNYNFDTRHTRGIYDQSPDQSTDVWCGSDPSPREKGKMVCTSLTYPQLVTHHAGIFLEGLGSLPSRTCPG